MKTMPPLCGLFLLVALPVLWGGEFRNLGFDDVDTSGLGHADGFPPVYGEDSIAKLLPGWTLYYGTNLQTNLFVNVTAFGDDVAELLSTGQSGRFSFELVRETTNSPVWTLEQTGTIPATTQFLTYRDWRDDMQVRINGQVIPLLNPPELGRPALVGTNLIYDVSAFAGREVNLAFVGPFRRQPTFPPSGGGAVIDSIQFVSQPPLLGTNRSGNQLILSWPAAAIGYVLQSSDSLSAAAAWQAVSTPPVVVGSQQSVTLDIAGQTRFYRLGVACDRCGIASP